MKTANTWDLAWAGARRHLEIFNHYDHYTGIVTLHGMARLATASGDAGRIEQARQAFMPFARGEREFWVSFFNYFCGGNGAAYFLWKGHLPEVREEVRRYAIQLMEEAPRDRNGIFCNRWEPATELIWIDAAFAVTPFLLFAGLAFEEESWIEVAFQHTARMVHILRDPENGLLHQSKNARGLLPGRISEDHWSRGNGWGIYAMAELACYLPENHKYKAEAVQIFRDHVEACIKFQDAAGMWHQEMTEELSFVETSGTGLILYGMGLGLEAGLLDTSARASFEKGLAGYLQYITDDLDVFHTCRGMMCPGTGTKLEYMAQAAVVNDQHAFGPLVLAYGQAHILGINQVTR